MSRFVMLAAAFAAGLLVERSGRLFAPFNYTPAGMEKTFAPFWESWYLVNQHYVDRQAVDPQRMTRGAIEGMLASLGDFGHTAYVTRDELEHLQAGLEGHLEGIGARLTMRRRRATVVTTFAGSPARAAGLRPGDVFLEVDGKPVNLLPLDRIVSMMRGPVGSTVRVRIGRQGKPRPLDLSIARAKVEVPDVTWSMLPGVPIAHIAIQNFGVQAGVQIKEAVDDSKKHAAKALILDIRGNPGGLKDQAVAVASEFIKEGAVFVEQDGRGNREEVPVQAGGVATDIPLCLLIDEGTASSSEIVAGAIQDHARGPLVGMRTFGMGSPI